MRKPVLLFDLGGTLVDYFAPGQFTPALREAIHRVARYLPAAGQPVPGAAELKRRVAAENHESRNHRVRPLHRRLARIFPLRDGENGQLLHAMSRAFMDPIFAVARRYDDTLDALSSWRRRGYRIGILSNASGAWIVADEQANPRRGRRSGSAGRRAHREVPLRRRPIEPSLVMRPAAVERPSVLLVGHIDVVDHGLRRHYRALA